MCRGCMWLWWSTVTHCLASMRNLTWTVENSPSPVRFHGCHLSVWSATRTSGSGVVPNAQIVQIPPTPLYKLLAVLRLVRKQQPNYEPHFVHPNTYGERTGRPLPTGRRWSKRSARLATTFYFVFVFLAGRDIHYMNATITTSKKCDVDCSPWS